MEDKIKEVTSILCSIVNNSRPVQGGLKCITINNITILYTEFEIDDDYYVVFRRKDSDNVCSLIGLVSIRDIDTIE